MPVFKNNNGKLTKLNSSVADKEKLLQTLVEENLDTTLDMHFLASEYSTTSGGRIDTLAIDFDGCPVIIEYKKGKNENVINQSLSYLKWLKAQKKEFFEMLLINNLGKKVSDSISLDWGNPRVICIAENYSKFDIDTVEVVPIRIELLRYRYYEDNIFILDPVSVDEQKPSQIKTSSETKKTDVKWTVDRHLENIPFDVRQIFEQIRESITAIDENITENAVSGYVGYRATKNFAEIIFSKGHLTIHLRPIDYDDPKNIVKKVPESFKWTMNRSFKIKPGEDVEYALGLIEKSYQDVM